jgi:lysozyme
MNNCLSGIDVSHYQGTIDWNQVRSVGTQFAFIKALEGITSTDPEFQANWKGAKAAGLTCGAYHFFLARDDPREQADAFLSIYQPSPGDLPPALDIETTDGQSTSDVVQGIQAWLSAVEAKVGAPPILYTGPSFWKSLGAEQFGGYPLWIADYGVTTPTVPAGWTGWTFWQYSQSGSVAGVSGTVDLDYFQGSLEDLQRLTINAV